MAKVGRKRKFLYLFREKWNEGKENAEFSIGSTFSFPPKLEGNREKRESILEHQNFFFSFPFSLVNQTLRMQGTLISFSFFSFQPLTFFSSPLHFPNIKSLTPCKINVLKLLIQNFNLVICNHEKGYNHHKQMKHYMISYNHILNIHQINFIQNPIE